MLFYQNTMIGRKILFIAPTFHRYNEVISEELIKYGLLVTDFYFSGYPTKCESSKYNEKSYWQDQKNKLLDLIENNSFDHLLAINLRLVDINIIRKFKEINIEASTILYLWDPLSSLKNWISTELLAQYDYRYTFDYDDYHTHPELNLIHRPTFYHPYINQLPIISEPKYDIASVMSIQPHRMKFLNKFDRSCKGIIVDIHVYISSLTSFFAYLINHSVVIKFKHIKRKKLSIYQTLSLLNNADCILDISPLNQNGLTLRCLDAIGMNKKLITTNKDIKKYDFYDPANILVIPPATIEDIPSFLEKPKVAVPDEIKEKYSISFWVKSIINHEEVHYTK
jgi:hypothetical protein